MTVKTESSGPLHRYSSYFNKLRPVMSAAGSPTGIIETGATPDDIPGISDVLYVLIGQFIYIIVSYLTICVLHRNIYSFYIV